jgi:hypothetical protein
MIRRSLARKLTTTGSLVTSNARVTFECGSVIFIPFILGKGLLADPAKFLDSLLTFDKDNIPEPVIVKIKPYIDNEDFLPAAIQRVSKAATSICQWVRAMEK